MSEQSERLKERTMQFAFDVLELVDRLPRTAAGRVIGYQLAKSATSLASNYRGTCNARSRAEFIAKLGVVVDEADESALWLELIRRRRMQPDVEVVPLLTEALELLAIFGKSLGTARINTTRHPKSTNIQINDQITR
jgi:four helix bundle protein